LKKNWKLVFVAQPRQSLEHRACCLGWTQLLLAVITIALSFKLARKTVGTPWIAWLVQRCLIRQILPLLIFKDRLLEERQKLTAWGMHFDFTFTMSRALFNNPLGLTVVRRWFCCLLTTAIIVSVAGVSVAESQVSIERNSSIKASSKFAFELIPSPSKSDAGNLATIRVVAGTLDANAASTRALIDGELPRADDDPGANFFLASNRPGRILFDFGKTIQLQQICSYSWHPDARAPQVYDLYVADQPFLAEKTTGSEDELLRLGWQKLASVDSRLAQPDADATQIAVSIRSDSGGNLASFRYALVAIKPTGAAPFSQTFYSEFDFLDGNDYPPATTDSLPALTDVLLIGDKYRITFDTTEVPDLRLWVNEKLKPVVAQWYPKIVAMLPSEEFQPPAEFRIVFKSGMRGVAYTTGHDVYGSGSWYLANREGEGIGSIVHELVHVVQQYPSRRGGNNAPSWLVEGIADQIRWYQFESPDNRRKVNLGGAEYTDSYFVSASFLDYIVRKIDPQVIQKLNSTLRNGRYTDDLWMQWYAKSAAEIWKECQGESKN